MKTLKLIIFTLSTLPLVAYSTPEPQKKVETKNIVDSKNKIYQLTDYKEAINLFKNKNYVKSFQLFGKLLNEYPNDKQINFYYARSAFELKNYEYAFSSFDLILINNPNDSRVRAEFARTLMMMKLYKEAKEEFNKVLLLPIPLNVRKNIEKMITVIESKEKTYVLNKIAIIGFGWDDNINNNTHIDTTAYGSLNLDNDTSKKNDTSMNLIFVGNLIVPNKQNNQLTWESTVISFVQEQSRYKENNIGLLSLSSGMGYTTKLFKNLTSVTYDHIWVGNSQTVYIYGLTNSIKTKVNKKDILSFDIKLKKKKFIKEENFDKSSQIEEYTLTYDKLLTNKKDKITLSSSFITERKRQGIRTDVDKDTNKYKISYTKNILSSFDITLGYEKELNKYKNFAVNLPNRDDDKKVFNTKLSHTINKSKLISLEYKNTDNKSNINTYSYKKQSVNLNYTIIF